MSYVLYLMSYVLCLMSYVLCLMSYILSLMSYVLCLMSYVLCLTQLYLGFMLDSSALETRDNALSSDSGSGLHEVVYRCLPHKLRFYYDTSTIRTHYLFVMSPHAQRLHHGTTRFPRSKLAILYDCKARIVGVSSQEAYIVFNN